MKHRHVQPAILPVLAAALFAAGGAACASYQPPGATEPNAVIVGGNTHVQIQDVDGRALTRPTAGLRVSPGRHEIGVLFQDSAVAPSDAPVPVHRARVSFFAARGERYELVPHREMDGRIWIQVVQARSFEQRTPSGMDR